ncbi:MAG: hypothetical protein ACI4M6_03310 [Christensenellaceae bacterium]
MKKKLSYSVVVTVCLFVALISTCFAWFYNVVKVNANLDLLTAQTPTKVRVNFNGSAVADPISMSGEGDLIPCLPLNEQDGSLKNDADWIIPSFLPSQRSKRCSCDFNFSFSGESGVKPLKLESIVVTAFDESNSTDAALAENVRYAVFLSAADDVEHTLIAHSEYYYGAEGLKRDSYNQSQFDYDFTFGQNIRVILWVDGYSCDYKDVLGGRINLEINFASGGS